MVGLNGVESSDRGHAPRSGKRRGGDKTKRSSFVRKLRVSAVVLALAVAIVVVFDSNTRLLADYADGVRAETLNLPDAVKVWRQDAWRQDDFLAQVRLGDIYSMNQSFGSNESKNEKYLDRVEAYVWYFMALRPGHDYRADDTGGSYDALYNIRSAALDNAKDIYYSLTFEQRLEARARIIYVLSSRGGEGYLALGRILGMFDTRSSPVDGYTEICRLSRWDSWFSRPLWWLWATMTGNPYPHPKIWEWVKLSADNQDYYGLRRYDSECEGQIEPPRPQDDLAMVNPQGAGGVPAGSVPLNNNGQNLPSPTVSIGGGSGDSGAVSTVNTGGGMGGNGALGGMSPRVADGGMGGMGDPFNNFDSVPSVFTSDVSEALTYFVIAQSMGHPLAGSYANAERKFLRDTRPDAGRLIADAEQRARYWYPPFEFYPGGTVGGIAHSDESLPTLEQRLALGRMNELPPMAVVEALNFRGYLKRRFCAAPPVCFREAVVQYQKAFNFEPTGFITPPQVVLLIKMAADAGDAIAQDRLGIMYAKGIGVAKNFVRAEFWFIKAANQGFPDAYYNLYVLYKVGPNGVEPDEHKAVSYATRAIAAAYNPSKCELLFLLDQTDGPGHDHPGGARR